MNPPAKSKKKKPAEAGSPQAWNPSETSALQGASRDEPGDSSHGGGNGMFFPANRLKNKPMKTCLSCGNKNFRYTRTQYIYRRNDKFLIVNHVPCEECEYCGEQYFQAPVLKKIENEFNAIHHQGKKAKTQVPVPMEHFGELRPEKP
ncbi:MAG: type II toxin-antitoxin system MqsA family antitoxin [Desulfococcaceae bacterium]